MSEDSLSLPLTPTPAGNWFVALPASIPRPWAETLQRGVPNGLRWYALEDCHLTVAFFGKYRPERETMIREVMAQMEGPEVICHTDGLELLPTARRFSAIALKLVAESSSFTDFIKQWAPRLAEAAGVPADLREPLLHVTLARPQRRNTSREQHAIATWAGAIKVPPMTIELRRAALYRWAEDRTTRQFQIVG